MRNSITVKTIKSIMTHCTKINDIATNSETIKICFPFRPSYFPSFSLSTASLSSFFFFFIHTYKWHRNIVQRSKTTEI